MPIRLTALLLASGLAGCALATRHAYFEPVPEGYPAADTPKVHPVTYSEFHLFGILLPLFPMYSRQTPLILSLSFPSVPGSCPPVRIGTGNGRVTLHATGRDYRSCHYELEDRLPELLELDWGGRTLRTGFRRDVAWSYHPFFFPAH